MSLCEPLMILRRLSRWSLALGLAALTGCLGSLSEPGGGSGGGGAGSDLGRAPDGGSGGGGGDGGAAAPAVGNLLCEATLSLSGTFQPGAAPPVDFAGGCWPDGQWTFHATVTANPCPSAPVLPTQFVFSVQEDTDYNDTITYVTDPSNPDVSTKISGGEGAICTGAFLIFTAGGKTVINLRPALQAGNVIDGQGDYRLYDADQR
jgi:hypothetical protein